MIGRLKGTLVAKQPPWLLLDVGGVGYELEAPMSTFYDLPETGREVVLCTHYAVKEDTAVLYGFLRDAERALFRNLQKVSGIGAKISLAVLSGVTTDEFARLMDHFGERCRSNKPIDPAQAVRMPGDSAARSLAAARRDGIVYDAATRAVLQRCALDIGVPHPFQETT